MGILTTIGSAIGCTFGSRGPSGALLKVRYSPGYGDMIGAAYSTVLLKDSEGKWIMEVNEREDHSSPTHVTTYSVSEEDAASFEAFIREKRIYDLQNRKDSDEFITDYSPWGWRMEFANPDPDKKLPEYVDIRQYKKYSNSDLELINALREKFNSLKGQMISQRDEK